MSPPCRPASPAGGWDELSWFEEDYLQLSGLQHFAFLPPPDAVNTMLSFAYSLLAHDCASALESVGLDSYVGFLHRDRPDEEAVLVECGRPLRGGVD